MADITSNLIHWYKFEAGSGTNAVDDGSGAKHGTLTNGPAWTTGKIGAYGIGFDGANDEVDFASGYGVDNQSALTIAYWKKQDATAADFGVDFSCFFDANNRVEAETGGSGFGNVSDLLGIISNGSSSFGYTTDHPLIAGAWHHAAIVFDGSLSGNANRLKIYVDGALKTLTFSGTIPATTPNVPTTVAYLGRRQGNSLPTKAVLDDFRIYQRALAAADVAVLYALGRPARRGLASGAQLGGGLLCGGNL